MEVTSLPFEVHEQLCRILDNGEHWRKLAETMKFSTLDIIEIEDKKMKHQKSPTDHLLTVWGHNLHDTDSLFICLYKIDHLQAMRCMAECVSENARKLLKKLEKKTEPVSTLTDLPVPVRQIPCVELPRGRVSIEDNNSVMPTNVTQSEVILNTANIGPALLDQLKKMSLIPIIPYLELCEATNNWSQHNLLGKGGFGNVYSGNWKETAVAIKVLQDDKTGKTPNRDAGFMRELCLNGYRHDNLLPLYAISTEQKKCLIYQLMVGGSLDKRLRQSSSSRNRFVPLTWSERVKIAVGTARGLLFLHTRSSPPLIHADIKPPNILLDRCLEPKIADFGLARKGAIQNHFKTVSTVGGTVHYLPTDYMRTHQLSPAVDVFSFGLVLFELATALHVYREDRHPHRKLRAIVHSVYEEKGLSELGHQLEDSLMKGTPGSSPELCAEILKLGVECSHAEAACRPDTTSVYRRLSEIDERYYGNNNY